jgi:hypothetical protein
MILARHLAVFAVVALASASSAIACSGTIVQADGGVDSSTDGTSLDRDTHDARDAHEARDARDAREANDAGSDASCVDAGPSPVLTELSVAAAGADTSPPFTLVPSFSPDVHDYYVRCAATNKLSVTLAPSCGAVGLLSQPKPYPASAVRQTVSDVTVNANQAVVAVAKSGTSSVEYWVRCLPPDFPNLEWETHPEAGVPTPGYYLLGNFTATGTSGGYAMVLNGDGVPVWYYHELSGGVCDLDALVDGGLTYFPVVGGPLRVVALSPFDVAKVAPKGLPLDFHELRVLANGHYLVISNPIRAGVDLTGLSLPSDAGGVPLGPGSNISDCVIVEFDPNAGGGADGGVVWTWRASDHFDPAKDCREPERAPPLGDGGQVIDTFHCNSIDVDPTNGNLLVSARQMDSAFYIDRTSGKVLWKMGGAPDSLDDGGYVAVADPFFEEHDVRMQPGWSACAGGRISLFDDETRRPAPARAVVYDVVLGGGACDGGTEGGTGAATLIWQYEGTSTSEAAGSHRIAADGSRVIGWGLQPDNVFTELDAKGKPVLELHSNYAPELLPMESYRAIKVPTSTYDLTLLRETAGR